MLMGVFHAARRGQDRPPRPASTTRKACNAADVAGKPLDPQRAKRIEAENFKTIQWPADGKFLGDWKQGEEIAQNGRGLTWTDNAKVGQRRQLLQLPPDHQGGDLLRHHRPQPLQLRQAARRHRPGEPGGQADASNTPGARSGTPRPTTRAPTCRASGHMGILNEQQVRDIMALLLDPQSPVNQ